MRRRDSAGTPFHPPKGGVFFLHADQVGFFGYGQSFQIFDGLDIGGFILARSIFFLKAGAFS